MYRMQDIFRISSLTYSEKVGLDNVKEMTQYAHNVDRCRRAPLADHFGEEWNQEMCSGMCDICKRKGSKQAVNVDVTDTAKTVLKV